MTSYSPPVPAAGKAAVAVEPAWLRYGSAIGLPVVGGALGWLLALAAGWIAGLPWAPFQGVFELVSSLPQPHGTLGVAGLGVLAGLGFLSLMIGDRLRVAVSAEQIELRRGLRDVSTVPGSRVSAALLDHGALVLLDAAGDEAARARTDITAGALRTAFRAHGYRWLDADPHAGEFELWVPDTPEVGPRADALLRARAHARKKGHHAETDKLRDALVRAGYLVRDEKRQQYWRKRPQRDED